MKLIDIYNTDLSGMDCHVHSAFSPDAKRVGAGTPDEIAAEVRRKGLRGFIVTDHIDVGHWEDSEPINFDEYFCTWERVRKANPDLKIYIGLEVGYEPEHADETYRLINDLPLEYVVSSVHFWNGIKPWDKSENHFGLGRIAAYTEYLEAVSKSLDARYEFSAIGHLGFPERYAPYPPEEKAIAYDVFGALLDEIIAKAVTRGVIFEENTNAGGEMRLPRADFLRAYKAAGGRKPMLGSDAHVCATIAQHFDIGKPFIDELFD